jgi:hypothetical protein
MYSAVGGVVFSNTVTIAPAVLIDNALLAKARILVTMCMRLMSATVWARIGCRIREHL